MFDNPYLLLKIIGILIGIAFLIYRFQFITMFISGLHNRKKEKMKSEIGRIKYSHTSNNIEEIISLNGIVESNAIKPGRLHLLKVIDRKDSFTIYFSVFGEQISIVEIKSEEALEISFEPITLSMNNSSGHITFVKKNPDVVIIKFEIQFDDQLMNRHSKKYMLSLLEKSLYEI